eukprot:2991587-Rhodomonas_salina.1
MAAWVRRGRKNVGPARSARSSVRRRPRNVAGRLRVTLSRCQARYRAARSSTVTPRVGVTVRRAEIQHKKAHLQFNLYQECGFLYFNLQCNSSTRRNQMRAKAISGQRVPGMRLIWFDFGGEQ